MLVPLADELNGNQAAPQPHPSSKFRAGNVDLNKVLGRSPALFRSLFEDKRGFREFVQPWPTLRGRNGAFLGRNDQVYATLSEAECLAFENSVGLVLTPP